MINAGCRLVNIFQRFTVWTKIYYVYCHLHNAYLILALEHNNNKINCCGAFFFILHNINFYCCITENVGHFALKTIQIEREAGVYGFT